MQKEDLKKLKLYEWGAVIFYLSLLTVITLYTQVYIPWNYPSAKEDPHWLQDPNLDVYITGAVKNPGQYTIPRGSTRGDLLTLADPLQNADLKRLKTAVKLKQGELVELPAIPMVTFEVAGEVEKPVILTVPKGTKVFEIQHKIALKSTADPKSLSKKRSIKDGETLIVKRKKV